MFKLENKNYQRFFNENFTDQEIEQFASRQAGHLRRMFKIKKTISTFDVLESFFILEQIEEKRVVFKPFLFDKKFSPTIKEKLQIYANEIWTMYVEGKGETAISSALLNLYKITVSKTTIKKFLLSNFEYRKNASIRLFEIEEIESRLKNKKTPKNLQKANEARKAKQKGVVDG